MSEQANKRQIPKLCPWCSTPLYEIDRWGCGSFQKGVEPWQSKDCEITALEQKVEKLSEAAQIFRDFVEFHHYESGCYALEQLDKARKILQEHSEC